MIYSPFKKSKSFFKQKKNRAKYTFFLIDKISIEYLSDYKLRCVLYSFTNEWGKVRRVLSINIIVF